MLLLLLLLINWRVVTGFITVAFLMCCYTMRKRPGMRDIPGYKTLPILGLLPYAPRSLVGVIPTVAKWGREFPDICYGHVFSYHYVLLSSARAVESIMSSKAHVEKGLDYDPLEPWFGQGLLTSRGRKWHQHRKLLTPAFHFTILDRFVEVMQEQAETLVALLQDRRGSVVDVWPLVANATLDVICETAMGVRVDAQHNPDSRYIRTVKNMSDAIFLQVVQPWRRYSWVRRILGCHRSQEQSLQYLLDFSKGVIARRREERRRSGAGSEEQLGRDENGNARKRLAFLDLLLDAADKDETFTEEDIREEVDTFMFEGHDTTTSGINWALYNIGRSPEVQNRIAEEIDQVLGVDDEVQNLPLDRDQLGRLQYLECAIKESLRLFPPVTLYSRLLRKPAQVLEHTLDEGTNVVINSYGVHRDPAHWPDPERFNPDRFLPDSTRDRHPFSYIPFSAGPRNCIGQRFAMMEMKIVLASILRRFHIETLEDHGQLKTRMSMTIQKEGPLRVRCTARNEANSI